VKCKPYRRRYVAFRLATGSTTGDLIYSLRGVLGEETKIKPIFQEGGYALVRIDQFAL